MLSHTTPEGRILPELTWEHLQPALIHRFRTLAVAGDPAHVWGGLSDEAFVLQTGLAAADTQTGQLRFNVAAALLLGTDKALVEFLPHHKTQAQFRPGNWRRGSRTEIRKNLLESLEALMRFVGDHLPEEWETTPSGERVNVRDAIFSEIITQSLVFRDYRKSYTARIVVESDRVFLENGMMGGHKRDPGGPNPLIANVFKQAGILTGRAPGNHLDPDSAVARWGKAYFGLEPMVVTGSVYRILAPFPKRPTGLPTAPLAVDISEMFTTYVPWTRSIAAQNEVAQTRSALETLLLDPLLVSVGRRAPGETEGRPTHPVVPPIPLRPATPAAPPAFAVPAPKAAAVVSRPAAPTPRPAVVPMAPIAPAPAAPALAAKPQALPHAERVQKILEFCKTPRYRSEVQQHVGIVNRDYFRKDILNPLIEQGLLYPTLPDKPNSPKQQYATVTR